MKLSDVAVRQSKLKEKPHKLTNGTGRYWRRYDYRFEDKRKTISCGIYPVMTLSAARHVCLAIKRELAEERSLMAVRKAENKRMP